MFQSHPDQPEADAVLDPNLADDILSLDVGQPADALHSKSSGVQVRSMPNSTLQPHASPPFSFVQGVKGIQGSKT